MTGATLGGTGIPPVLNSPETRAGGTPVPLTDLRASQHSFLSALGRAQTPPGSSAEDLARDAARQFVSQTFIQPLLKQLRSTDNTAPPFSPGPGEKQFRALEDAELAQRIVTAQRLPIVDRVARRLLSKPTRLAPAPLAPDSAAPSLASLLTHA